MQNNTCTNCGNVFSISDDDLSFYKKIGVPFPTHCPRCRLVRRYAWRNERNLYRRKCGLCQRDIITIYSEDKPFTVYCSECYHGDGWDALSYGRDFDFSRPFFEQFRELQEQVPRLYAFVFQNVNSEYTNGSAFNKNCYLLFVSDHNEDSYYSHATNYCKNVMDCYGCTYSEFCYESLDCNKCYKVLFSQDCSDSQNLLFCKNCTNCQDCIGSVNLRNKKYHIFNKPYTKDGYEAEVARLGLTSRSGIEEIQRKFAEHASRFVQKYSHGMQNKQVTGDYVSNSKNSDNIFDASEVEDSSFINHGNQVQSCYDGYVVVDKSQYSYEIVSAIAVNDVKFGYCVWHDTESEYCDTCENCTNIFGCIGLRKQSYCILNKQYTKEEYEELVPKIIEHMKAGGEYGEFFPMHLSPFAYNETVAQEYFPLGKGDAQTKHIGWKTDVARDYHITMQADQIPNRADEIPASIEQEILGCEHAGTCTDSCTTAFRIASLELQMYQRLSLPLPRLCPNCRHAKRVRQRNPRELWPRACQCLQHGHFHGENGCGNKFMTTYSPEVKGSVYCEKCYQAEVS